MDTCWKIFNDKYNAADLSCLNGKRVTRDARGFWISV